MAMEAVVLSLDKHTPPHETTLLVSPRAVMVKVTTPKGTPARVPEPEPVWTYVIGTAETPTAVASSMTSDNTIRIGFPHRKEGYISGET